MTLVLPLLAVLSLGACGTTRIFHADFNADMINSGPNPSPPTDPAGDEIWMPDGPGSGQFTVVNSTELGSQALRFAHVQTTGAVRILGFVSTQVSPASTNELVAIWDGIPNFASLTSPFDIALRHAHGQETVVLRFQNGKISLRTPGGGSAFEEIGTYTNGRVHSIIMNANKATQTYTLSILERNSPAINVDPRPILSSGAFDTNRPALVLWYPEGTGGSGNYLIDNVLIRRKD